ncbi:MAG TPA: hypothetical protein VMU87_02220 [Stellaceae bacterium]|nr:hypothetical protein [Stellaceae bacterium]
MKQGTTEKTTSVERLLLDHVERLERNRAGRRAVVIRLSRLRPNNRGSRQIRIAANTFEALVKQFDGQMFVLQQGDIVFICKYENASAVDAAVTKVRYLFDDDPLTAQLGTDADGFADWFDLDTDFTRFRALAEETAREDEAGRKRLEAIAPAAMAERQPMDPTALGELINAIATADVSNLLRRQAVCTIAPGEVPRPLFRELYVSIADLRDTIMPRRDLFSDRWLFQYLTQTLDKRVLALLRKADDVELAHSYSLNLNVSTLLSPEFLAFDASLKSGARGSIVIEIEKVEIFADLGAYLFARDFARERGYRFCLDSVTRLTLPFMDRNRLGVDLIKLFWNPDMAEGKSSDREREFLTALERVGNGRVILARCDTEQAIEFGHRTGIKLFQGRIVDTLLNARRPPTLTRNRVAAASR